MRTRDGRAPACYTANMQRWWTVAMVLCLAGCPERALEIPEDGGLLRDLGIDLATDMPVDFAQLRPNACPAGTEFIFTIDESRNLSRFNPVTQLFYDVGFVNCPAATSDTPNSMAIDHDGTGWVNYGNGGLFRIDTKTGQCAGTPFIVGQQGFIRFGMSFAQNAPGSAEETLFVSPTQTNSGYLASVNLKTYKLENVVPLAIAADGELTGDDQANLWGFFPDTSPPRVARIDKKLGTLDRQVLLPQLAGQARAWGFAAWRGDFYIFLERVGDPSTAIYLLDGTSGSLTTVIGSTGRRIVGVGVATCAGDGLD